MPLGAKWGFAARAGTTTEWSFGGNAVNFGCYEWYSGNAGNMTCEVGRRRPNPWGLYDIHGNVWEWVYDRFGTYPNTAQTNPAGPAAGDDRMARGGCWRGTPAFARSATRFHFSPGFRFVHFGFRLVRPEFCGSVRRAGDVAPPLVGATVTDTKF